MTHVERYRFLPLLLGLLLACVAPAGAVSFAPTLNFATVNQSQWAGGQAFVLDESLGKYIDPTLQWDFSSYDLFNTSPSALLMKSLGISIPFLDNGLTTSAGFGTRGKLGFDIGVHATSGHVNVNYPVRPRLDLPDTIPTGAAFVLNSSWGAVPQTAGGDCLACPLMDSVTQAGGSAYAAITRNAPSTDTSGHRLLPIKPVIETYFPALQAFADLSLEASGDVRVKVSGKVGAFGIEHEESWEQRVSLPTVNKSTELLRVDSRGVVRLKTPGLGGLGLDEVFQFDGADWVNDGVKIEADVKDALRYEYPEVNPWVHVQGYVPKVDTRGGLAADGRTLSSYGQDDVLTVSVDVPHLAGQLLDVPLALSVPATAPNLKLDLVSGTSGPAASVYQRFEFVPNLSMHLRSSLPISRRLDDGLWTPFSAELDVPLGAPLELRVPISLVGGFPTINLKPEFLLDGVLTNETGIVLAIDAELDALTATFPSATGDLGIGPLVSVHGRTDLGELPIYEESFHLGGFRSIVGDTISLPTSVSPRLLDLASGMRSFALGAPDDVTGLDTLLYAGFNDEPGVMNTLLGTLSQEPVLSVGPNGAPLIFTFFRIDEQSMPELEEAERVLCLDCVDLSSLLPSTTAFLLDAQDHPIYLSDLHDAPAEPEFDIHEHPEFDAALREVTGTVIPGEIGKPVITVVPVPGSGWLMALALIGLGGQRRVVSARDPRRV